ncbi:MAG: SGNH/GDSL hydrolase family protein [Saprospiraceae bacterium]
MNLIKAIKLLAVNLVVVSALLVLLEGMLLMIGVKPYTENKKAPIYVQSEKRFFQKDSLLGYKHCLGGFDFLLKGNYQFSVSHDENTFRKTSNAFESSKENRPEIWLLGCSFTYGWSLNDKETFAWCLQEKLNQYKIVNLGVNGYGTLHFYLQLKATLESTKEKPEILIVNHADFHHERNINSYNYNRSISTWNNFERIKRPFVETNNYKKLNINYCENKYTPWEISKEYALAKSFQFKLERFIDGRKFKTSKKITTLLLDEIKLLCRQNNIQLLITNVGLKKKFIKDYTLEKNIPFTDIAVDYRKSEFNNLPHDKHPSAKANRMYCERIYNFMVIQKMIQ